jgi:hypothetical protein
MNETRVNLVLKYVMKEEKKERGIARPMWGSNPHLYVHLSSSLRGKQP